MSSSDLTAGGLTDAGDSATYSKIESELCALLLDEGEEAGFLIGRHLVGEGGGGDERGDVGQQAVRQEE